MKLGKTIHLYQEVPRSPKQGHRQNPQKCLGRDSMPARTVLDIPVKQPVVREERRSCPLSVPAQTVLEIPVTPVLRKERRRTRYNMNKTMLTCLKFRRRNFNQLAVHLHTCNDACSPSSRL